MTFDAARRQIAGTYTAASGLPALAEDVHWSPRNLKIGQSRHDLNKVGQSFVYDDAARLVQSVREHAPLAERSNNSEPDPESMAGATETSRFYYDSAQNMIGKDELVYGVNKATEMPTDASGRNRPGAIGVQGLSWDANGNLTAKGEQLFYYDYRNRLTLVTDLEDQEVARYSYDAFNRRVRVTTPGQIRETAWQGWQAIEEYENDSLKERRIYGNGLDETVCLERDLNGDGVLEQTYLPLYDSTGNLAVMTDGAGKPIERGEFQPFGLGTQKVDLLPPVVEQVRVVAGEIWLELSEEVLASELEKAVGDGSLTLYNVTADEPVAVTVSQPVTTGDQARRRMMVTTTDPPAAGDDVRLTVAATALVDFFHNQPSATFEHHFPWPATDEVLLDTQAPTVAVVIVRDGVLEIELTEEVDLASATSAIEIEGATTTWTMAADRYTLVSDTALASGAHVLSIGNGLVDLAGTAFAEAFTGTVVVDAEAPQQIVYRRPDPRDIQKSTTIGNRFAFHGLPIDPETGFVYVRNRYYDPEMGRFITTDPLGYVDGPSMYQFAGYNAFNYGDPLGLEVPKISLFGKETKLGDQGKAESEPAEELIGTPSRGFFEAFKEMGWNGAWKGVRDRLLAHPELVFAAISGPLALEESLGTAMLSRGRLGSRFGLRVTRRSFATELKLPSTPASRTGFANRRLGDARSSPWLADKRPLVVEHLEQFREGGSYLVPKSAYDDWVKGRTVIGRPDGQFITTRSAMDKLLAESGGDLAIIEKRLGIPKGQWKGEVLYRVDIDSPLELNGRLPSGFEDGADKELFRWGGYTDSQLIKYPLAHSELPRQE